MVNWCKFEGCKERAKYGVKQFELSRCKEHKETGMVTRSHQYCEHNRRKEYCKDCEGSGMCKHKRQKRQCRDCKGSLFCIHDKRKDRCKDCKGASLCKHDIRKSRCKECDGSDFCKHDKRRETCRECGGSRFCKHDVQKSRCKECGGSGICKHDKRKADCRECRGSSFCKHDIRKEYCEECGGSQLCKHKLCRRTCYQCNPESTHFCIRRYKNGIRCPKSKMKKYRNHCTTCFVELFPDDPLTKTAYIANKELNVLRYLTETFPDVFIHNHRLLITDRDNTCTQHNRRIDFQTAIGKYVFCIEVDENQHKWYNPIDEEKRIMQIYENADRKMVFIRFNPDNYKQGGKLKKTPLKKRLIPLRNKIKEIIDRIENGEGYNKWFTEIKMFFDDSEAVKNRIQNNESKHTCAGITRKKEPCKNKISNDDKFCYHHRS